MPVGRNWARAILAVASDRRFLELLRYSPSMRSSVAFSISHICIASPERVAFAKHRFRGDREFASPLQSLAGVFVGDRRVGTAVPSSRSATCRRRRLLEQFTAGPATCLFATMGFWQGVDVPGPSLSLVAIDRIPFRRPDEPLLQARRERAGADAFGLIDLPAPPPSSPRAPAASSARHRHRASSPSSTPAWPRPATAGTSSTPSPRCAAPRTRPRPAASSRRSETEPERCIDSPTDRASLGRPPAWSLPPPRRPPARPSPSRRSGASGASSSPPAAGPRRCWPPSPACSSPRWSPAPRAARWLGYVQATAEASMVGGLADWFAVVALFRHPLGLPIPHTAIITERKEQFGETLGEFIQTASSRPTPWPSGCRPPTSGSRVARWLADPVNADRLAGHVARRRRRGGRPPRGRGRPRRARAPGARADRGGVDRPAGRPGPRRAHAGRAATTRWSTRPCAASTATSTSTGTTSADRFRDQAPWWLPGAVEDRIFERLLDGVRAVLDDMANDRGHGLRRAARRPHPAVRRRAADLAASCGRAGEQLTRDLLERPELRAWVASAWADAKAQLRRQAGDPDSDAAPAAGRAPSRRAASACSPSRPSPPRSTTPPRPAARYVVEHFGGEITELVSQHDRPLGRRGDLATASSCCSAPTSSSSASTAPSSAASPASASTPSPRCSVARPWRRRYTASGPVRSGCRPRRPAADAAASSSAIAHAESDVELRTEDGQDDRPGCAAPTRTTSRHVRHVTATAPPTDDELAVAPSRGRRRSAPSC